MNFPEFGKTTFSLLRIGLYCTNSFKPCVPSLENMFGAGNATSGVFAHVDHGLAESEEEDEDYDEYSAGEEEGEEDTYNYRSFGLLYLLMSLMLLVCFISL